MANTLGNYDETFFAQEALLFLRDAVGLSRRVHTGYDREYGTHQKGSTIEIRGPGSFSAGNAPTSTATDLAPRGVTVTLDQWKDVVFSLTDKDMALSAEQIRQDHITPAMVALVDTIEDYIQADYWNVPWALAQAGSAAAASDITEVKRLMRKAKVPLTDVNNLHFALTTQHEKDLLDSAAFAQWQGAGQQGASTQMTGELGRRYGFNFFGHSRETSHTATSETDLAGAVNNSGGYAKGVSSIAVDAFATSGVYKKGDTFQFADHASSQRYALTADVTMSGGANATFPFTPALVEAVANDEVITFDSRTGNEVPSGNFSLAFHRNWYALAFGRLPQPEGTRSSSIQDPDTGLSVRVTQWYEGKEAAHYVRVDVLYGGAVLDGNLAVRMHEGVT